MNNKTGVTNNYINKILHKKLKVKLFQGVFSADTIPTHFLKSKKKTIFIVNLSKYNEKGTHFITVSTDQNNIYVYDSLALELKFFSPFLYNIFKKSKKKVIFVFNKPIQSYFSDLCGFYAIYFVLILCKKQFPNRKGHLKLTPSDREIINQNNDFFIRINLKKIIEDNK